MALKCSYRQELLGHLEYFLQSEKSKSQYNESMGGVEPG